VNISSAQLSAEEKLVQSALKDPPSLRKSAPSMVSFCARAGAAIARRTRRKTSRRIEAPFFAPNSDTLLMQDGHDLPRVFTYVAFRLDFVYVDDEKSHDFFYVPREPVTQVLHLGQ